jgi:predicted HTH transcriptional regulator
MKIHDKMKIHDNSKTAYEEEQPNLSDRELKVYRLLKHNRNNSYTDKQVSRLLNYPHHSAVQPRISDLLKKGLIREAGTVKCDSTGKTVRLVKFASNDEQLEMF